MFAAAAYDPASHAVMAFGGATVGSLGPLGGLTGALDDTLRWDGSAWQMLAPTSVPTQRSAAGFAWDPASHHLLLVDGWLNAAGFSLEGLQDVWAWNDTTNDWEVVSTVNAGGFSTTGRMFAPTISGIDGFGVMSIGGEFADPVAPVDDMAMWRLAYTSESPYETCVDIDTDGDGLAGCADTADCAVPCAKCGDGTCDNFETCVSCPGDCGACP
jgi:hypothetical protein